MDTYYNLVFEAGGYIGQSLIVFLLVGLTFDYIRKCLFERN